ncbi:MAG TPA: hypothetical protein VM687_15075 [Stenotrophomonas sp.]|nr:hypothetical protein [Stenotrophomonas sp.]
MSQATARWWAVLGCGLALVATAAPSPERRTVSTHATNLQIAPADRRAPEQTFLTFPEWFLVFSPAEYARAVGAGQPPSDFPFFGHVAQFWSAYRQVSQATRGYPFNREYHTMITVIGVSTTVEYTLKGSYELVVGRITEALAGAADATPEDRLAAAQAQAYVDFIRVRPWYEFDFITPLRQLWTQTPAWGPAPARKWERRYLLTSEWLLKAGYAAAIQWATRSTFEPPKATTVVIVDRLPANIAHSLPDADLVSKDGDAAMLALPRYQAFTDQALRLARSGTGFIEIAGNRGDLLVSIVSRREHQVPAGTHVLIQQAIATRPGYERRVLQLPVSRLSATLVASFAAGDQIEHVFDY